MWQQTGCWELLIKPSPISPCLFCWTYTSLLYDLISSTVPQHGAFTISKIKIFWSGYRGGSHVWFLSCEKMTYAERLDELNLWTSEEIDWLLILCRRSDRGVQDDAWFIGCKIWIILWVGQQQTYKRSLVQIDQETVPNRSTSTLLYWKNY